MGLAGKGSPIFIPPKTTNCLRSFCPDTKGFSGVYLEYMSSLPRVYLKSPQKGVIMTGFQRF